MKTKDIAIVTPIFNDWQSFKILIKDLGEISSKYDLNLNVIAVDDCSTEREYPFDINLGKNINIRILRLNFNIGHQRAISVGLCEAFLKYKVDGVIVMDSDGEDKAEDIISLIRNSEKSSIVVAQRSNRTEGIKFSFFYKVYKLVFKLLSGQTMNFGNFCYIPWERLESLVYTPNIWNHLAASILKSKIPIRKVAISRGKRYFGKSKMNFNSLILHGLGAMSVFIELIFTRILFFLIVFISLLILIGLIVILIRLFTSLAIPGWTSNVTGVLTLTILQAIIIIMVSAFMVLNSRSAKLFIPAKDSQDFIAESINFNKKIE